MSKYEILHREKMSGPEYAQYQAAIANLPKNSIERTEQASTHGNQVIIRYKETGTTLLSATEVAGEDGARGVEIDASLLRKVGSVVIFVPRAA